MKHALSILVGFAAAAFLFAAPAAAEPNNGGGAGVRLAPLDSGPELDQCIQRCQKMYGDREPYGAASTPQGYACLQSCHAQYPN
jgi:hypothetical protein